ncbi:Zinc finger BED domain-containing protein DAYSLEEPER [Bienertia sinuspersici]
MKRHTNSCKKAPFYLDKRQTILDFESKTRVNTHGTVETVSIMKLWHINQDEIRKALVKMLIVNELPFSFVERQGFHIFTKSSFLILFQSHVLLLLRIVMGSTLRKESI